MSSDVKASEPVKRSWKTIHSSRVAGSQSVIYRSHCWSWMDAQQA